MTALEDKVRQTAVDAAQEYVDGRWPDTDSNPGFVQHLAETHFQDHLTRAIDEAGDALDESRENPADWVEEAERTEMWSRWFAA